MIVDRPLHELGPDTGFWNHELPALLAGDPAPAEFAVPGDNSSSAELAPDQLAAVTHPGLAARIIAPAGSGKTRVLTERARHLVTRWGVPTAGLMVVAYNRRAQEEIVARTPDLPGLRVRTLNALALAVVNGTPPFAAQPRQWQTDERITRDVLGRLVATKAQLNVDPYAPWVDALSTARLGLLDPAEVEARYGGDVAGFEEVFPAFRQALHTAGQIDFDEQVVLAIELLLGDPAARATAQRACRVLLVDEFQDLTPAHLLLIRLLAGPAGSVFGVGDDDQTIYGYNGADPRWLIEFERWFPGAGDHPLTVNYRCPAGVVEAADRLLRHNTRRVPKLIRPAPGAAPGGWRAERSDDPVAATVATVRAALDAGAEPGEIAVLTRVNSSLAPVQLALALQRVPVTAGVDQRFADRTAVRAACAWLQLATGEKYHAASLQEAARRPSQGFSGKLRDWVSEQRDDDSLRRFAGRLKNDKDAARVVAFADTIVGLRALAAAGATTEQLFNELFGAVGLGQAVGTLDLGKHGTNAAAQSDDLQAVRHLARLFPEPARFEQRLRAGLGHTRPDGVVLATVHRVKGLEWPHVVVHLADTDQFPHRLAEPTLAGIEEERRVFHVALTRAGRHVTVVSGAVPSPFVAELTTEPDPHKPSVLPVVAAPGLGASKPKSGQTTGQKANLGARSVAQLGEAELMLFEALRNWRRSVADGKPAYTVFDDKTLAAIVAGGVTDLAGLAQVKGVGPAKLDKYGAAVLAVLTGRAPE